MNYKLLIISFSLFTVHCFSQQWQVPANKKAQFAPFKFDKTTVKQGEALFNKFCLSCHGTPGKGNNIKMTPPPPDPASKVYQKNTDGELFYKMTEGRGTMPSFKNVIEEKDRWLIISYVRSFNKAYVQPKPSSYNMPNNTTYPIQINLSCDDKAKCLNIHISQNQEKINLKSKIVNRKFEVTLYAKRYFGNLKISDTKQTDDNGFVSLNYPADLPGDKEGSVSLNVKVENDDAGIIAYKDSVLKIGVPVNRANLLDNRAMWNVRSKAPLWLMISYSTSLLVVLGIILYIVSLLYKIWENGKLADFKHQ